MRVLFVLEYFHPHVGGVETLFRHLTEALAEGGCHVSVITLCLPGARTRERRNGVEIFRIKTPQAARRYLFTLLALPLVLWKARSADVIHTTTYNAALPAFLAAAVWNKPSILTVHEVFGGQWNTLRGLRPWVAWAFRLFEWLILRLPFRHFVCDSAFTRYRLLDIARVHPARASVVYPAIDYTFWNPQHYQARELKRELGLGNGTFLYLYFGRPGISKGLDDLLEAALLLREQAPGSRVVLLLPRDPLDQYQRIVQRIASLGLEDFVLVLDPVARAELPGYVLAADCVVIPSISEGFGYAAMEAALLGRPVIATQGHAVEEVLGNHVVTVPSCDPTALAAAMLAQARGDVPPPRACPPTHFTVERHVQGMADVYARSVAKAPPLNCLTGASSDLPPVTAPCRQRRCSSSSRPGR